ncbi:MAG: ComF family protein [Candidatus Dojkabacteria bacterium]
MFNPIINTLIPSYCLMCNRVGVSLCTRCIRDKIFVNWNTYCCVCNSKVKRGFIHDECKDQTFLDGHIFMVSYNEGVKELIMQGKYSFYYNNFKFIGQKMSKFIRLFSLDEHSILVPIPLTRKKKNKRGFNQSEVICNEISKYIDFKTINLLKRTKDVSAQADLSGEKRRSNLKGIFAIDQDLQHVYSTSSVILVDDVYTTGSTLNECAKVLKENGVQRVYGYTFAKSGGINN